MQSERLRETPNPQVRILPAKYINHPAQIILATNPVDRDRRNVGLITLVAACKRKLLSADGRIRGRGRKAERDGEDDHSDFSSEERRVGKECVSKCKSRWRAAH